MKLLPRSALSGAFCALAGLTACELPAKPDQDPAPAALGPGSAATAPAPQDPSLAPAQAAFLAWADALPSAEPMPPMQLDMSVAMAGSLADFGPQAAVVHGEQDMSFALNMKMGGDMADWTRFRIRMDAQMDLAVLKEQSGGQPVVMGCNLVGDGETIWLEPDWSKAWFAHELREQGVGIENMVFSIQVVTVRQLLEVMPLVMPEEARPFMQTAIECTATPAGMARLTARTAQALSFERRGGRVFAELETRPETWAFAGPAEQNPFLEMFQDQPLRWRAEFDAATGVLLRTEYLMAMGGGSMSVNYLTKPAERPFGADHFRYQLPAGRKVFPVDVFMNPIVMELRRQAGAAADPSSDDFEF